MAPPPEYDPRYLAGAALFDRGEYFAAHEAWEDLWRACPAADRRFLQSLIQASVALYHYRQGNPAGAAGVAARGRAKAAGYPPGHLGVDLAGFWRRVDAALAGGPAPRVGLAPAPPARAADDPDGPDHDR